MENKLGALGQRTGGMVGHWGMLDFKAMTRLDDIRTKTKYILAGREKYNAIIFPLKLKKN